MNDISIPRQYSKPPFEHYFLMGATDALLCHKAKDPKNIYYFYREAYQAGYEACKVKVQA